MTDVNDVVWTTDVDDPYAQDDYYVGDEDFPFDDYNLPCGCCSCCGCLCYDWENDDE